MSLSHRRNRASSGRTAPSATSRLHLLIEWLRSGRTLTTTVAADALGVSRRTIARDLAHLREARGLAIEYDPTQGTYTLDQRHAALPFVPHPDLLPAIVNGTLANAPQSKPLQTVHVRYSPRSVRAYEARSGMDLSDAVDASGHLDVHFEIPNVDELVRWVLSSGAEAEVVGPPELRERVVVEIRRMLAVYDGDGRAVP